MKRLTALFITVVMLMSCICSVNVWAKISSDNNWRGYTFTSAKASDGVATMTSTASAASYIEKTNLTLPESYKVKFTMQVETFGNGGYTGLWVANGSRRCGVYIYSNRLNSYGNEQYDGVSVGSSWHEYTIDVSGGTQQLFIDGKLIGNGTCNTHNNTQQLCFFAAKGAVVNVENFSITNNDGTDIADALLTPPVETEYTPEFTTNWAESTEGWVVTDSDALFVNENGNFEYNYENPNESYLQIERAPKFTKNFDVEFGLQIHEYGAQGFLFKCSIDGYNNFFDVKPDRLTGTSAKGQSIQGTGFKVDIGNEWHDWKLEVRGTFMTIYMDGGEVCTFEMPYVPTTTPILRFLYTRHAPDKGRIELGNVHYKPYFPDVDLVTPAMGSEYIEGSDITFKANAEEDVDYIDYYVSGLKVGRGYAPDYEYTLKNAKVGTYRISAAVGDKKSPETTMTVVKAFEAKVVADKTSANYGEEITLSLETEKYGNGAAPEAVEFFAEGQSLGVVTAPFEMVVKDLPVGDTAVYAKVKNNNGAYFTTDNLLLNITTDGMSEAKIDREYQLDYELTSDRGNIEINDGYYSLKINHQGGKTSCIGLEETPEYNTGKGKYRVVVTSGYAEVYYNGHFSFSCLLPRTDKKNVINTSGVSNFVMGGRGNKFELFNENWKGDENYTRYIHKIESQYSLEFDKTDASDEVMEIYDGEYGAKLEFKGGKIHTKNDNRAGGGYDGAWDYTLNGDAKAGYYRLMVVKGLAQLYVDNKYVDSFAMVADSSRARIERTMSNPGASTIVSLKTTDDWYYHSEDFSGNKEFDALDYWVKGDEGNGTAEVKNGFLNISGGEYLLNGQANKVDATFSLRPNDTTDFYITMRKFIGMGNMKIGYNYTSGKWYVDRYSIYPYYKVDGVTEYDGYKPALGEWHDFDIELDDRKLVVKCDGNIVIETTTLDFPYAGYTGFGSLDGSVDVDNVEYAGRCKVAAGVKSAIVSNDVRLGMPYDTKDGNVRITSGAGYRETQDRGETWSGLQKNTGSLGDFGAMRLNDGRLVSFRPESNDVSKPFFAYVSDDDGETWTKKGQLCPADGVRRINTCLPQQALTGRVFISFTILASEQGYVKEVLYYSDDLETWYETKTPNFDLESGLNLQEGSIAELPDGTIRWFGRTILGFVYYADSKDGGETFGEWRPSQLMHPLCTYAVQRDNEDSNTYWAVLQHDAVTWDVRWPHRPRNRFALWVSRDGMQNWEYVMTLNEHGDFPSYDACNHVMRVFDDTIYIQWNNLDGTGRGITYSVDKTKVRSQKRLEEVHERLVYGVAPGAVTAPETMDKQCILPKTTGMARLYGENSNIVVNEGMYSADTVASVFGATVAEEGNVVTFKLGDAVIKFSENSSSYEVDGVSADFEKVCMKNGYLDIMACAKAFGKQATEVEDSIIVWYNVPMVKKNK